MAAPATQCDHRRQYWPTRPACDPDMGYDDGYWPCEQEPTAGPATGVADHGPRTICLECWQHTMHLPHPAGFDFLSQIEDATNDLVYQPTLHGLVWQWDLRNHAVVRGYNHNIESTQTPLCKTCTEKEVARWRLCEANQDYAHAFIVGRSQWAADEHTNTCVCVRKYITHPHYCLDCMRGALDDRLYTADQNRLWLHDKGHSAAGQRRLVSLVHRDIRVVGDYTIPCRCGRDVDRYAVAAAPQATFCLACNGTKIWTNNIPAARYPVRATRSPLSDPAAPYPLQLTASNVYNDLPANLQDGAPEILRSQF